MSLELIGSIIVGVLGLLAIGLKIWWGKIEDKEENAAYNSVVEHNTQHKLDISKAEKIAREGRDVSKKILAGELTGSQLNELRKKQRKERGFI